MIKRFFSLLFCSLFFVRCSNGTAQQRDGFIKNVNAKEFKTLVDAGDGITLDVRTPEEVAAGQIPNASTINFYDSDFVEKINLMNKEKEIYVYCKVGGRSAQAAEILNQNGFKKVYNLSGGINAWVGEGFQVTKSANAKDENIKQMTLAEFNTILNTDKPVLIDFHTLWCSPCKKMAPVVDKIEKQYQGKAVVQRIDVDKSKEIAKQYQVQGVPVFILFKKGKAVWKHTGIIAEETLTQQIESNL
ncbi:MAG: thioredoxin fold domain-containing protein [Bacteroidia bacterium]|nr:thioredoxin fold domain-containing protein [Bacteroidia bacterium]